MAAPLYPLFMDLEGRRCVVVGGGKVALRKARRLAESGARVVVVAPEVLPELAGLAHEVVERPYRRGDLDGASLVFAATNKRAVNAAVAEEARDRRIPANVADAPGEGDFAVPSVLRRGALQVAISTGGASPALARRVRRELEERFGPEWTGLVGELSEARKSGRRAESELEGVVDRCLSQLQE
ncbi:precorrin-2 dehydrogenase/sirohydrochlorin ferrochelatase family protein [Rubrobacter taiwanensis]|nr:bifunctional precorrin-2 dehydrogenase/sirohydrochlorin ferrochelatase [Rubrobacter taiwanensis]